ncbi:MAG: NUDIX domain-containing protein [Candidatus Nanoarchaeia archaeon]|nr:NUDIX domain-containing protein [Candidatus Nanoarchaeia archaeon]MDD5358038.1 NUDIX domain-containing protein [Candidatus Nanoarchaeia archaeon]MDD5588957.1 NUDIX domain-containing protein [Candidatus Nanoarchaeia archaeon]
MEKKITELFLTRNNLKFHEIEKALKVRSNKLDYHLKKLIEKNILKKEDEFYMLTESSESLIPYISDKNATLPVVLILIGDEKNCFLYERVKRPYKNLLGLPGGRILLGEDINDSVKRIMKEKHGVNADLKKINSISLEHIEKNNKIINSFFLIYVSAKTKENIELTEVNSNKTRIIKSDYNLIKNDSIREYNLNIIKSLIK